MTFYKRGPMNRNNKNKIFLITLLGFSLITPLKASESSCEERFLSIIAEKKAKGEKVNSTTA